MAFQVTPETDVSEAAMFHGALVELSGSPQSVPTASLTRVAYNDVILDTDGFFDAANNTFVIPEGVEFVSVCAAVRWNAGTAAGRFILRVNVGTSAYAENEEPSAPSTACALTAGPRIIPVATGDVLSVTAFQSTGVSRNIIADERTYFQLEVIKRPVGRPDSPTLP